MWQYPFSTLLFSREETLVTVRFPPLLMLPSYQNNSSATKPTQLPNECLHAEVKRTMAAENNEQLSANHTMKSAKVCGQAEKKNMKKEGWEA